MTDLPSFVLDRAFDAPPALVWRGWTEPALFARWYGPGAETTVVASDPRPGGQTRITMSWGGQTQYQRLDWLTLEPLHRIAFVLVTTDAGWTPAAAPQMADWPQRLMTVVDLTETAAGTAQRLTWTPHDCSAAEIAAFAAAMPMLGRGWGAGFGLLAEVLETLQAA